MATDPRDPRFRDILRQLGNDDRVTEGGGVVPGGQRAEAFGPAKQAPALGYDFSGVMNPQGFNTPTEGGQLLFYKPRKDVVIPARLRRSLGEISEEYFYRTNTPVYVNSGYRGPAHQASVMYDKIAGGDRTTYAKGRSSLELMAMLDRGIQKGQDRRATEAAMTALIKAQMANGRYVSQHLVQNALDFAKPYNAAHQDVLRRIILKHGHRILKEKGDDHIHTSFVIR